jgi:hypothetical protein
VHLVEAARLALPLRALSALGQGQEPEGAGREARSRRGLGPQAIVGMTNGFKAGLGLATLLAVLIAIAWNGAWPAGWKGWLLIIAAVSFSVWLLVVYEDELRG